MPPSDGHELEPEPWSPEEDVREPGRPPGFPFAGVGRRVGARLVLLLVWSIVLAVLLAVADLALNMGDEPPDWLWYTFWLLPLAVDVALVATRGWDPGKLVLGLRVVDRSGEPPGFVPAVLRTAVVDAPRLVSALPAVIGQFGSWASIPWACLLIWTMTTGVDRKGWQDRVAGTWVIDHRGADAFRVLLAERDEDRVE